MWACMIRQPKFPTADQTNMQVHQLYNHIYPKLFYAQIFRQQQYRENDKMMGQKCKKVHFSSQIFFSFLIFCQYQQTTYIRFPKILYLSYCHLPQKSENRISNELEHISEVQTINNFGQFFLRSDSILTSVTQTSFKINNFKKKKK